MMVAVNELRQAQVSQKLSLAKTIPDTLTNVQAEETLEMILQEQLKKRRNQTTALRLWVVWRIINPLTHFITGNASN